MFTVGGAMFTVGGAMFTVGGAPKQGSVTLLIGLGTNFFWGGNHIF